jgi:transcriptional regulator with XRE-family HTH domain
MKHHPIPSQTPVQKKYIGQLIRHYRDKRGYTQEHVADLICISKTQLQKYESGETDLPYTRLCDIVEILAIPLEMIVPSSTHTHRSEEITIETAMCLPL